MSDITINAKAPSVTVIPRNQIVNGGGGTPITVDDELSTTSENPVQNKVITAAVSETAERIETNTSDISDLKSAFTANLIHDTVSGSIANFPDGAALPVRDLSVDIEPVQDLHGYDNPWPAGGGKNLLPMKLSTIKAVNTTGAWDGNAYTLSGITINVLVDSDGNVTGFTLNGTSTSDWMQFYLYKGLTLQPNSYVGNGVSGGSASTWRLNTPLNVNIVDGDYPVTLTQASTADCVIVVRTAGTVCNNVNIYPMIRLSSEADSTFAPYSNICPISGWTGAKVRRTGKNLYQFPFGVGLALTGSGNNRTVVSRHVNQGSIIKLKPNTKYTLSGTFTDAFDKFNRIGLFTSQPEVGSVSSRFLYASNNASLTFTTEANECYALAYSDSDADATIDCNRQLEEGTATAYEPYQGETYTITFPSSAGTVYGGTLDVTTGKLTVDRVKEKKQWGASQYQTVIGTVARKEISLSSVAVYPPTTGKPQLSSIAPYKAAYFEDSVHFYVNANSTNQLIMFLPVSTSDDTEFEVSYELATPIVYDLTPTEVSTLLGTNNVWADTGDTTVDYYADPTLFVNKKIAAAVAAMS